MPTVDEMRLIIDAEMAKMMTKFDQADRRVEAFTRKSGEQMRRFDNYIRTAGASLVTLGGALGVGQVIQYANAWTRVERSLDAGEQTFGVTLHNAKQLSALASDARIDVEAYTKTYIRAAAAIRDYGYGSDVAAKVTSTLAMALKLGSAAASEQASVILQFSQALQKGKLDGDEFRSVMENAGVVQELLAQRLKVTKGEIVKMAGEGKLRLQDLVGAMTDGAEKVERIFRQMPQTVDESITVLRNAVIAYIGDLDEATGATEGLAGAIGGIARNIEPIVDTALTAGAGLLAAFGPRAVMAISSVGSGVAGLAGPFGIAVGSVAAMATAMKLFGDDVTVSADGLVTLGDTAQALVDILGAKLQPAMDEVAAAWQIAADYVSQALSGVSIDLDALLSACRRVVNLIIGLNMAAVQSIISGFRTLPAAVAEQFIVMANAVRQRVEDLVKWVVETLDALPGIDIKPEIDFGQFENPFAGAGARARDAMAEAGGQIGRDFVGEFSASLDGLGTEVANRAREIAELREAAKKAPRELVTPAARINGNAIDQETLDKMKRAADQVQRTHIRALEATKQYRAAVQLEYERDVAAFQEMLDKKLINQEQFEQARSNLATVAAREMIQATEREFERMREVTDSVASSMQSAFDDFTETGKFKFSSFAASVLKDLASIAFRMSVIEPLFGRSGESGGLISGLITGLFGGARANGGGVEAGKMYLVGERGPELFAPGASGTVVPNSKLAASGDTFQISIDARGSTPDAVAMLEKRMPSIIVQTVREAKSRGQI